jgi:hypothetical protein
MCGRARLSSDVSEIKLTTIAMMLGNAAAALYAAIDGSWMAFADVIDTTELSGAATFAVLDL